MDVGKILAKCYIPQEAQNPNLSLNAFSNQATGAVVVNFPRVLEMIITFCIPHHFFHYHCYLSFSMQSFLNYSGAHKRSDANTLFSYGFYIC